MRIEVVDEGMMTVRVWGLKWLVRGWELRYL